MFLEHLKTDCKRWIFPALKEKLKKILKTTQPHSQEPHSKRQWSGSKEPLSLTEMLVSLEGCYITVQQYAGPMVLCLAGRVRSAGEGWVVLDQINEAGEVEAVALVPTDTIGRYWLELPHTKKEQEQAQARLAAKREIEKAFSHH